MASNVGYSGIHPVAAPLPSTQPLTPRVAPVADSASSSDTISVSEKPAIKPDSEKENWFRRTWHSLFPPKDKTKTVSDTSSESTWNRFQNWLFKTKDEKGDEIPTLLGEWKASLSDLFKGSEGHRLSRRFKQSIH